MTSKISDSPLALLSSRAVRERSNTLLDLALAGALEEWTVDLDRLSPTADFVAKVIRERYPQLTVPVHSRWRHLVIGGRDLWSELRAARAWPHADSAARSAFDLIITSVLLDAGAGAAWHFKDRATGLTLARSEGLALASLRLFESGGLALDPADPYRVDAAAVQNLDVAVIARAFQADDANPLLGLAGRADLLNRLGTAMNARPDLFALADTARPGGLFDALRIRAVHGALPAALILETLLEALGPIWQGRPSLDGVPLGDCWPHPALGAAGGAGGYVPLHKLSQWLAYSLIEPLEAAGIVVSQVEELTGLAEYRNGGLFVDLGVLKLRDPQGLTKTYAVADPLVVGWRALTVALLDRLAPLVSARLGVMAERFPLACLLEGGTWAAGRLAAREVRSDGGPPFHVLSDGTVF